MNLNLLVNELSIELNLYLAMSFNFSGTDIRYKKNHLCKFTC